MKNNLPDMFNSVKQLLLFIVVTRENEVLIL